MLNIFCDCVRSQGKSQSDALAKITNLDSRKLLDKVIHILLVMIPQYSFAKGQCLHEKDKARWIKPDAKKNKWIETKNATDPATSMYVLLSVIESLQWHRGDHFFAIPDLLSFIQKNKSDKAFLLNIPQYKLSLSQLSMYLTAPEMSSTQKSKLTKELKANLIYGISQLCDLVRAINVSYFRHSVEISTEFTNWFAQRFSRGLLGISNAREITYYQEFLSDEGIKAINGKLERRSVEHELNYRVDEGEASGIAKLLTNPWGRYVLNKNETTKSQAQITNEYALTYEYNDNCFMFRSQNKGLSTKVSCLLDESNRTFHYAVENSQSCVSHLLNDIVSISRSNRLLNKNDWYKQAFGEFYYHYDRVRHETMDTHDFKIRRKYEAGFYLKFISDITTNNTNNINVLDIGIGYGRLEKNLFDKAREQNKLNDFQEKIIFSGLDISREMKRLHSGFLEEQSLGNRYKLGEMTDVCDIFGDNRFDLIILLKLTD